MSKQQRSLHSDLGAVQRTERLENHQDSLGIGGWTASRRDYILKEHKIEIFLASILKFVLFLY